VDTLERLKSSPQAGLVDWANSMLSLSKEEGMTALLRDLAVGQRLYVHADTPRDDLKMFADSSTSFSVLAPMDDIDGFYLGKQTPRALSELQAMRADRAASGREERGAAAEALAAVPTNVSTEDFDLLRRSLTDQALAFVLKEGELVNNTSVVLLLEWRGRRLLFTGDAEAKTAFQGAFQEDKGNGSWNVMWHRFKDGALSRRVDFLKVGHHGSFNATPWTSKTSAGGAHPINEILDRLLPALTDGAERVDRYAVVSTERSGYPTIPDPALMMDLAKRITEVRKYQERPSDHSVPAGEPQPPRTDLETADGSRVPWIDIKLEPLP
jgi:hypothetical protein